MVVGMLPLSLCAGTAIEINATNFPDEKFRTYVSEKCDKDKDKFLSEEELASVKLINVRQYEITSLDGIKYFTSLEKLICSANKLTSLDVSQNTALKTIDCSYNQISALDVSKNTALESLECRENQITALDVSENTALESLACCSNKLTTLDVSNNTNIVWFYCFSNQLTSLILGENPNMIRLFCYDNQLTNLDIRGCEVLLNCYQNASPSQSTGTVKYTIINRDEHSMCIDMNVNVIATDEDVPLPTPTEAPTPTSDPTPTINPTEEPTPTTTPTKEPTTTVKPTTPIPTRTPELSVGDFAERCYSVALGRVADEAGYDYWVDSLNNGQACGAQVGYGFIFSDEYMNKDTSDEQYVEDLYAMYFGREADEAGYNYWLGLLKDGTSREVVFAGFANSEEFYNLCEKYGVVSGYYLVGVPNDMQGGVNCFVARMYKVCLNRLPDIAGQSGWVMKLQSGEVSGSTCAYGFVMSPEFINLGLNDTDYVCYMYRAFFGREADEEGLNYWVGQLETGTAAREDIFAGFSGSLEFSILCASYGINS